MVEITLVNDDEELYRSVREETRGFDEYNYDDDKNLVITPKAFNDREKNPSVDRATLKDNNPELSKKSETDGILTLLANDVRKIGEVKTGEETNHSVDVLHKPDSDNLSHAEITVNPAFYGNDKKQKRAFKLLRISLAYLATKNKWTLEPKTAID